MRRNGRDGSIFFSEWGQNIHREDNIAKKSLKFESSTYIEPTKSA